MNNPFIKEGYLLPIASLNRLPIMENSTTAQELCSAAAIKQQMQSGARMEDIANVVFRVLLTLQQGPENRSDWNTSHWMFWRSVRRFYFAGGMLGGELGPALISSINRSLIMHDLCHLEIQLADHPPLSSLIGAAKYASQYGNHALVFDFGHSYVKQGYLVKTKHKYEIHHFESVKSQWTQWTFETQLAECEAASRLSDFIISTIVGLYHDLSAQNIELGDTIVISIANYVSRGSLAKRGGFGKLNLLADPYHTFLTQALRKEIGRKINIFLLHDGTAGAYAVQDSQWQSEAFLGLGTSLSVGFPAKELNFPFPYEVISHL